MYDPVALLFAVMLAGSPSGQASQMEAVPRFEVTTRCGASTECAFDGGDIDFELVIKNVQRIPAQLPLSYLRALGPSIRLLSNTDQRSHRVPTNMPRPSLLTDVTLLAPGQAVIIPWSIGGASLERLGGKLLDVTVKVTIAAPLDGSMQSQVIGTSAFRITRAKAKPLTFDTSGGSRSTDSSPGFEVTAGCRGQAPCIFDGRRIDFEISVRNVRDTPIHLPLEFIRFGGPYIVLHDNRTQRHLTLPSHMFDGALLSELTVVGPGQSVSVSASIDASYLEAWGGEDSDVTAVVKLGAPFDGSKEFRPIGTTALRIIGTKAANRQP